MSEGSGPGRPAGGEAACEFCAMARGEAAHHPVLEDDDVLAFMDIRPLNEGHVLLIPRRHVTDLFALPGSEYRHLMESARRVAMALRAAYAPPKVGYVVTGFEVPHAHIHVLPLHHPRDITSRAHLEGRRRRAAAEALSAQADRIREELRRGAPPGS